GGNIAAMASRFMLNGAQLPDPGNAQFARLSLDQIAAGAANEIPDLLLPLYTMTGQQVAVPAAAPDLSVTFSISPEAGTPWVRFAGGGESLVVTMPSGGPPAPSTTLVPALIVPPAALDFGQSMAVQYPLTTSIAWTAAAPP